MNDEAGRSLGRGPFTVYAVALLYQRRGYDSYLARSDLVTASGRNPLEHDELVARADRYIRTTATGEPGWPAEWAVARSHSVGQVFSLAPGG